LSERTERLGSASSALASLRGWRLALVVYVVVNAVLWGGQELLSRDEQREAETIEASLNAVGREIDAMEASPQIIASRDPVLYQAKLDEYNALIPRYNTAAEKAYSRWWLLPIPMPGSRSRLRD
jgi:hypothetical protein